MVAGCVDTNAPPAAGRGRRGGGDDGSDQRARRARHCRGLRYLQRMVPPRSGWGIDPADRRSPASPRPLPGRPGWHSDNRRRLRVPRCRHRVEEFVSILGTRVLRTEDPKFLTTGGEYTEDLVDDRLAGAAHVFFVRSPVAHARIGSVDLAAARARPGVIAAYTAADLADLRPVRPM